MAASYKPELGRAVLSLIAAEAVPAATSIAVPCLMSARPAQPNRISASAESEESFGA
jgi:hypothetical protein